MTERSNRHTKGTGSSAIASTDSRSQDAGVTEEIEVRGHIVDSLLLPKILDRILHMGGTFEIRECKIGVRRVDPSYARIAIQADNHEARRHPRRPGRARRLAGPPRRRHDRSPADIAGAFPEAFTARPTSGPRSAWEGAGSTSPTRRWIAASPSIPVNGTAALRADEPSRRGHADRRRPRRACASSRWSGLGK